MKNINSFVTNKSQDLRLKRSELLSNRPFNIESFNNSNDILHNLLLSGPRDSSNLFTIDDKLNINSLWSPQYAPNDILYTCEVRKDHRFTLNPINLFLRKPFDCHLKRLKLPPRSSNIQESPPEMSQIFKNNINDENEKIDASLISSSLKENDDSLLVLNQNYTKELSQSRVIEIMNTTTTIPIIADSEIIIINEKLKNNYGSNYVDMAFIFIGIFAFFIKLFLLHKNKDKKKLISVDDGSVVHASPPPVDLSSIHLTRETSSTKIVSPTSHSETSSDVVISVDETVTVKRGRSKTTKNRRKEFETAEDETTIELVELKTISKTSSNENKSKRQSNSKSRNLNKNDQNNNESDEIDIFALLSSSSSNLQTQEILVSAIVTPIVKTANNRSKSLTTTKISNRSKSVTRNSKAPSTANLMNNPEYSKN